MALANVVSLESGTNFIINVSAAQLSDDVTEKDFTILHNGVAVSNVSYNKTTQNTIQYVGASLPSTTVEVRRKTSFDQVNNLVTYANRFTSDKWNEALLRIQRWEEEVDLNGAGSIGAGVIPTPANDAYGAVWTNDTIYPATRKALWDKIETLAPKASPTFTGVPVAPTAATATSSTQLATTAFVKNVLGTSPTITNPTVSNGSFTSPTIATPAINGGTISNVAWTNGTLTSPQISGANILTSTINAPSITGGGHLAGGTTVELAPALSVSNHVASTNWVQNFYYTDREQVYAEAHITVPQGALTQIGMVWNASYQSGGAYAGTGGVPNWCRVATGGWFRIDFKFEETSGATDYSYITAFVERNTTTGGVFGDIARLGTWAWSNNTYYPMYSAWAIVGITWGVGVDKIIGLRFQHNNAAAAARNFKFWYNIEKLRY